LRPRNDLGTVPDLADIDQVAPPNASSRHQLSPEKTAPVEVASDGAELTEKMPETHCDAIALGPFLTLILTLRRRRGSSGSQASFAWAGPFVKIRASG